MIKHYVEEEEKPEGLFALAEAVDLDMAADGEELSARKEELAEEQGRRRVAAAGNEELHWP